MRRLLLPALLAAAFLAGYSGLPAQTVNLPVKVKGKAEDNLNTPDKKESKEKFEKDRWANLPPVVVVNPVRPNLTPVQAEEPVLAAMEEEISRGRTLRAGGLEAPYFVQQTIEDAEQLSISASLGSLLGVQRTRRRPLRVEVRVGAMMLDNTNAAFANTAGGGVVSDLNGLPLDNEYWSLRHFLWLATDRAYKGAIDAVGKKKAALNAMVRSEVIPDFSEAPPSRKNVKADRIRLDEKEWTARVRSLSEIFASYASVYDSVVSFEAAQSIIHLVNTEQTSLKYPDNMFLLRVRAISQASDGTPVYDGHVVVGLRPADLAEPQLRRAVQQVAANVERLGKAPRGDRYMGPVLFEPYAAAQFASEVLGAHLPGSRRPVTEPGRTLPIPLSEYDGRLGSRVLPEWLTVIDDPQATEWRGQPLVGAYPFDMEGVVPQKLTLVDGGVLKTYLMTRMPVRGLETTNGRARLPGAFGTYLARPSNLILQPARTESLASLKQRLIDMVRQQGKPYGILIRKTDYPSAGSYADIQRQAMQAARGGAARILSAPLLIYRVYPDGREELVRGLRFRGVSTRTFRDLLAASTETEVFSYLDNGLPLGFAGAGGYVAPTSVVAPGLLFEEIELEPSEEEQLKLPLVPPPSLTGLVGAPAR